MTPIKKLPIIHKTKTLFSLDFEFLDNKVYQLFIDNSKFLPESKRTQIKAMCLLLNCFLGLQNKKISLIEFLNKKSTSINLSQFIWFLKNGGFNISKNLTVSYANLFIKIINQINCVKNTDIIIKQDTEFNFQNLSDEKIQYFSGWWISTENKIYELSIQLHKFFNKFGNEETDKLFFLIRRASIENQSLYIQGIFALNKFINFLADHSETAFDWDKDLIIKSFIKDFFINKDKNNYDLHSAKKEWNAFNKLAQIIFNLPEDLLLIINVKGKQSFEHNIKHTKNGQIKTKLITEIPLEICDDKALAMLIQKINQDVQIIKDWANYTINNFVELTKDKSKILQSHNYGNLTSSIKDIDFNRESVFQRRHALAIAYLLIAEHPEITESFLLNCDVNKSIKETDQGVYLVSYKNRKGPNLAEQQILLNLKSLNLVNILLEETKIIRDYLINTNNKDYEKLFICCNSYDLFPTAPKVLNEREGSGRDTNRSIIDFLINEKNFEEQDAINFANKITLTKMRASRGVQVYLETESTTKMAQALGHTRHRPELLAHYLPEPITDFFQRRWISIFQKGIICEALKESDFLLKATGFSSMSQLDEFLRNHTLKKIPDNSASILNKNKKILITQENTSEVYISVDEQKLSALLSLQQAVKDAENKEKITANAYYWSLFTERLTKEICTNRFYSSFRQILDVATTNINKNLFKEVIYVE
jgi:hypothetical protein